MDEHLAQLEQIWERETGRGLVRPLPDFLQPVADRSRALRAAEPGGRDAAQARAGSSSASRAGCARRGPHQGDDHHAAMREADHVEHAHAEAADVEAQRRRPARSAC